MPPFLTTEVCDSMDQLIVNLLDIAFSCAVLALVSAGLAIVFGMMRVINLAHGEFLTLGGYTAIVSHSWGLNIYFSVLVAAPLMVAVFGLIVERFIIRPLYGRLVNTMLATWGLSLLMMGALTMIFGNTTTGISSPIGAVSLGEYQVNGYNLFVMLVTVVVYLGIYMLLKTTRAGLVARASMQDPVMASAFGQNASVIYQRTFAAGAALSGLAGGVMAPLIGLSPTSGGQFIAKSFITVISGGTAVVAGTLSSAGFFGVISQWTAQVSTPVMGEIALLVAAILLLRLLPTGISGRFFKNRV